MTEVAAQLAAVGVPVFPCNSEKKPTIKAWQVNATTTPDQLTWPSGVIGIPISEGVTVIDLDTYKGVTREQVEQAIGCALPWDDALIQRTRNGGEHYAFAVDWDVQQGSDLLNTEGFDTRCAGRGYICTGEGYTWVGNGPMRLGYPAAMLPALPDAARHALERVQREVSTVELPQGERDIDLIREALRHINADCSRTEWVRVGMALKHHFHDSLDIGKALWLEWSEYAADRLDYDDFERDWNSFKTHSTDGASITLGSIMYDAMKAGWSPPADVNTALAFGAGAAPLEVFGALVDCINESGGDPKATTGLIEAINGTDCSDIQRATLLATLTRELKEAGLLTKSVRNLLEGVTSTDTTTRNAPGRYGKNHCENAILFIESRYPNNTLLRSDEVWYAFTGKYWEELEDSAIKSTLAHDMVPSLPQSSTVKGTLEYMSDLCHTHRKIGNVAGNLVIYENGVLNTDTWMMGPHQQELFTTNILPYSYDPHKRCPRWVQFLEEVFSGDQERIDLLQEWLGYLLTPSYSHHKIMLLLGPPRSGKGTIGRILRQVVGGQNYSGGTLSLFAKDSFLEGLRTKPVLFISDAETKVSPNTVGTVIERMKTISGNDEINFTRKFKSNITETLPTRTTIVANGTPRLFDDSGALAGRFLVVPMDRSFEDNPDITLGDTLAGELEGIAVWALAGLSRLNQTGVFTQPQASQDETQYIKEAYSPLKQFIEEVCVPEDKYETSTKDMYSSYNAWAISQGDSPMTRRVFTSAFKDTTRGRFGYGRTRIDGEHVRAFKGVRLRAVPSDSATSPAFQSVK